jgi:hypothetical protein
MALVAAGWLAIWLGAAAPVAAEPAIDWHALCVEEIRRDVGKTTTPPPASIELGGETVRVIAVPTGNLRINKGESKCAARIIDAFRLLGANSVSFFMKELDTSDYNKEQCIRESKKPQGYADTYLINYIALLLKCVPNRKNAAKIREWLDVDKARTAIGYRNIDFRLFELAFAKSERCSDQKDFAAYYECFANAISEADLSKLDAVGLAQADVDAGAATSSQDAAPVQTPRLKEALSPGGAVQQQGGEDYDPPSHAAVPTPPPIVVPTAPPASAPRSPTEPAPAVRPANTLAPASSATLLRDYLLLLASVTLSLVLPMLAWKFSVRRSLDAGGGFDQELAPAEARELSLVQDAVGVDEKPADAPPIVPTGGSAADSETVQELKSRLMTMESQISELRSDIAVRDCDLGTAGEKAKSLLGELSALESKYREQRSTLENNARDLQELAALRRQLIKEQDERAALRDQFTRREEDLNKQRDDLTLKCRELTHERDDLKRRSEELASERVDLLKQRDDLAGRLEFTNSQAERLKSGLPMFVSPADLGNPLSEFWVTSAKADPQAHGRLEGVLRSYKIASDNSSESSGKLFELVNDIGVQLYALMDAIAFDEPRKREVAANWQVALNADGNRRFMVSVPWPGTPIEPLEMVRTDQRCRSERIECVRSWVVKDKDGRVARRAIVE